MRKVNFTRAEVAARYRLRANLLKGQATAEELVKLATFYSGEHL